MFKVTSFDFGPYLKLFDSLEDYIYQLRDQLTYTFTNARYIFMEDDLSKVTNQVPL